MKKCSVFHIILQKSVIFDSGLAPLLQQSSWYFGSSHRRWSVRSSRCVIWALWRTGDIPGLGRMEDSQGSMVPGRPSMVFTGRLCTDSCSRSSINYGGCDTGGRNVNVKGDISGCPSDYLFHTELGRSQDTC